ncbi:hypothetical protein [Brevundimonas sp.]|uniref:hypothetical protein n=1 Tax=Brevundimonas sp. TaxID=1871086 RepID=UPI001DFD44B8|nr:hypothetical protein [Brevundimonas sp.]MBL0947891.1 hypothetical protein [Brevundimonas sp.]
MSKPQFVFSRDLTHPIKCPHCGVRYEFTRKVEVKRNSGGLTRPDEAIIQSANDELDTLAKGPGGEVVRCPSCRKLGPGMLTTHLLIGLFIVIWIVACLGAAALILWLAAASGALLWMLGLLALAGAGIGAVAFIMWLFGGFITRGHLPRG